MLDQYEPLPASGLILLVTVGSFGALAFFYAVRSHKAWRFYKCFLAEFTELSAEECRIIFKDNRHLMRRMISIYLDELLIGPEPSLSESMAALRPEDLSRAPIDVARRIINLPSRLINALVPVGSEEDGRDFREKEIEARVLAFASGLRKSLAACYQARNLSEPQIGASTSDRLPRFKSVWAAWLRESPLPAPIHRGLHGAFSSPIA